MKGFCHNFPDLDHGDAKFFWQHELLAIHRTVFDRHFLTTIDGGRSMENSVYVLVADSGGARIFTAARQLDDLTLVYEKDNPEGRKARSEIDSDRPGTQRNDSSGSHGLGGDKDAHRHASEQFASSLSESLHKDHLAGKFSNLMIIAPPQFLGSLRQHLHRDCAKILSKTIAKDLQRADTATILSHLV